MDQWSIEKTSRRSVRWIESESLVSSHTERRLLLQVFLGQFSTNLRMRMQKILDGGCAIRSVHASSIIKSSFIHILALIRWIHQSHTSFEAVNQYRTTHKYWLLLPSKILLLRRKSDLMTTAFSAHMVSPQWLLDCCIQGDLLSEATYLSASDRDDK